MKIFQVHTSSTQMQNRSIHVVDRIRTAVKFIKMKIADTKRAKPVFFFLSLLKMQISD